MEPILPSWGTPVHRYNNGQEVAMQGIDLRRTQSFTDQQL